MIPSAVASAFGLEGAVEPVVPGGRVSQFWRARTTEGDDVAVRRSPWFRSLSEVAYECRLLRRLAEAEAPVARPAAEPIEADGAVWTSFAWIPGHHPSSPVPNPARYGRLLAALHRATDDVVTELGQRPGWGRLDGFMTQPRAGGTLTLADTLDDFARSSDGAARLARAAVEVHERLSRADLDTLPHTIAHGDFGPHQVLLSDGDEDQVAAVVDWDFSHHDLRITDLAVGSSLARPTLERASAMLAGYLDESRLDIGDLTLVADLRRAFHLHNLANQVCALWVNGADLTASIATLTERIDREQWWGPTLIEASRSPRAPRRFAPPPRTDLDVAHALADCAAVVAMHYFRRGVRTETKADDTPVTEADRAVEVMLREALAQLRPADAILGEELGHVSKEGEGEADRTWILDPIDGTNWFARRDPNWRIQIALQEGDDITVAIVDAPALGVRWWAASGGGTWERSTGGDRRLSVSETSELDGAVVACHPPAVVACHPPAVAARLPDDVVRPPRSPLPLVELVRGEIDAFFVECCQVWDHAPWILLVREAGGAFTDHAGGGAPDQRGGLYSNAALHAALHRALLPPR